MAGKRAAKVWLCTAGVVFVTASAHATITVDGTLNESDYGTSAPGTSALATQTVASSFGSNQLDAAYAVTENGEPLSIHRRPGSEQRQCRSDLVR